MTDFLQPKELRLVLEKGLSLDVEGWGDFSKNQNKDSNFFGGEFVFCTSMTGIEESLTDPSYRRQILVSTVAHVGNTGFTNEDTESRQIWAEGLVVRHLSEQASSWRAKETLLEWILREKKFLIHNVDTRMLTVFLRTEGSQRGIVFERGMYTDEIARKIIEKEIPSMHKLELISEVSCEKNTAFEDGKIYWPQFDDKLKIDEIAGAKKIRHPRVAVLDFGAKTNTPRILSRLGCEVVMLPADSKAEQMLEVGRDGVFLSNGPGDPEAAEPVVQELKKVIGQRPVFGICMGHQLLALALGAKTYKLKFGHRGIHHPVVELKNGIPSGRTLITSQNHGFAVDEKSLPPGVEVTFRHANDGSNEGIANKKLRCASVQFHPEAAPGPFDALFFFEEFVDLISTGDKQL